MGNNQCLLGKVIFSIRDTGTLYDWFVCLEVRYVYYPILSHDYLKVARLYGLRFLFARNCRKVKS
jgi:hypothetical protein